MDPQEFFANLPRGKEDKPLLFSFGPITYNHHDIDGLYSMLDKDFSGCILMNFAKPMNDKVKGTVTLDGQTVKHHCLKFMPIMGNLWVLAVRVRGLISEYGKEYVLHVEGFVDEDGNEMNPQDFTVQSVERVYPQEQYAAHEAIALQAAEEGIVLLENKDDVLPLKKNTTLNVFGKAMHQFRVSAAGAGKINPRYIIDFFEAVREGDVFELNEELVDFYRCDEDAVPEEMVLQNARSRSDTAVMMITRSACENIDNSSAKGEYYLSDEEDVLMRKLSESFAHVIVILNTAYPIDVSFVSKYQIKGLIYLGIAGMLAGPALLHVLSGKINPSGKLTDTWAKDYFDIPSSRNFYDSVDKPLLDTDGGVYMDTCYEEDIYVGYRYFKTFGEKAAYPFGYGLSYTAFKISASKVEFSTTQGLAICAKVTNTGQRAGKEVVQIYAGQPDGKLEKPERILIAFDKTRLLQPGESQELYFEIDHKYLTSYDEQKAAYVMDAGTYTVYVGNDVNAPVYGSFILDEVKVVKQVSNLMTPNQELVYLSKRNPEETWPQGEKTVVKEQAQGFVPRTERRSYASKFSGRKPAGKLYYGDVKQNPELAEDFVAQMSVEELARISVCASAGWGMEGIGEAGRVFQVEGYQIPNIPVADGNSGVNLNQTNIGMPSGAVLCSSFNRELIEEVGRVIAEEARELGVPLILAPAFNIHRNPLCGRNPEYFSEDPYLAGVMAGNYVKGMEEAGVATSMKHLLANNCESTRKRNMSILSERALREIYFRAFEIAMDVKMPATFMTAYNACNGQPTAADSELLQGLLREECGFDGFIMTDWGTYDSVDIAEMVQAGNSWITPGSTDDTYTQQIVAGVADGRIELERLQENVTWLIKTLVRYV